MEALRVSELLVHQYHGKKRNYLGGRKNALGAEKKGFKFDT